MAEKKASGVWNYFERVDDGSVRCVICKTQLASSGSTSSMRNHVRAKHPGASLDIDDKQKKISFVPVNYRLCDPAKAETISNMITRMLAIDVMPLSVVDGDGFKALIEYLAPSYELPGRKAFTARIEKLYEETKANVMKKLATCGSVVLTTDGWTSCVQDGYITVTCHYVDVDFQAQSLVLATREVEERHTAATLQEHLQNVVREFGLTDKVSAVVHDNASNVTHIGASVGAEDVACGDHTLQLAVNAGLQTEAVSKMLAASNRLVGHFKHSVVATNALKRQQESHNVPKHRLVTSVKTRWNSQYDMLERITEQRWPITAVLSNREVTSLADARTLDMKDSYWDLAANILKTLKPLQLTTTLLSGEQYVTSSVLLPVIKALGNKHLQTAEEDEPATTRFKETVLRQLNARFTTDADRVGVLVLASVCDPRYKALEHLPVNVREGAYEKMRRLLGELVAVSDTTVSTGDDTPTTSSQSGPSQRATDNATDGENRASKTARLDTSASALDFLLGEDSAVSAAQNVHIHQQLEVRQQLERYLLEPKELNDTDPLAWWRANGRRYPHVAAIARKMLSVPATSVASERVFSTAGHVVSKRRNRLDPEHVDQILFLAKNLE
jgi:hypothetical protein